MQFRRTPGSKDGDRLIVLPGSYEEVAATKTLLVGSAVRNILASGAKDVPQSGTYATVAVRRGSPGREPGLMHDISRERVRQGGLLQLHFLAILRSGNLSTSSPE